MTTSQINYFLAVADSGSFSKAAGSLFVSQPAVSRQISQLEQELGVSLFSRTSQGIILTDAGREFAEFFRNQQRGFQELVDRMRRTNDTARGTLNIGCTEGWDISSFFPGLSAELGENYPNMSLNVSGYNLDHILHALERGETDVVITNESLLHGHEHIASEVLTSRRGVLLFSAQHRLAKKSGLALADFKEEIFYITTPPTMREAMIELYSLCADAEFVPKIEYTPTLSTAYMKLSSGRGVLLCNDWMMAANNPLFTTLPLHINRNICIAWSEDNFSPLAEIFVAEIRRWFQNHR